MRRIGKAFRRPPTGRMVDRNGGLPRQWAGVARGFRCAASLRRTLLERIQFNPVHIRLR